LFLDPLIPRSAPHPALTSFPTRRSSDLTIRPAQFNGRDVSLIQELFAQPDPHGGISAFQELPLRSTDRDPPFGFAAVHHLSELRDRKSTRLNSSHEWISYAVFCLKKKTI